MAGLGRDLIDKLGLFYEATTVPANTTINATGIDIGAGGQNGGVAVRFRANTAIAITDTKILTLIVADSADNSSFATINTFTQTASGATTIAVDTLIHEFILPSTSRKYVRVTVTTNDASVTGKIDAYLNYPAR